MNRSSEASPNHPTPNRHSPNRPPRWLASATAALAVAGALVLAPSPASAAGLLIADGGFGGELDIEQQDVEVTINNGIAVTHVTQIFRNKEDRQVEALYTFPVPKNASVSNFSMWIGGKEVVGEVLKKERAREIYDSYKQVRRDPGLLEQTDYKTFEMRIFPIAPRADQKVQISYYQELDYDHDWATYVYPLAKVTRQEAKSRTTGRFSFNLRAASEVPLVEMESPSHRDDMTVTSHTEKLMEASLEQKAGDLSRDLVVAYRIARPVSGLDLITSNQPGEEGFFCLTMTAGKEVADPDAAGMDFVFLLDVSGSMADDGKLTLSRNSVGAFLKSLGKDDRFEVITFNTAPSLLFQSLTPAAPENLKRAEDYLASQGARGGTVLRPALEAAYRYRDPDRPLNVVILSDGMTEQRERSILLELIGRRSSNAKVFCVGVGNEVDRTLLTQVAEDAGGVAAFVSQGDDFSRQAAAFRRKLTHPVATNVKFDFEGVQVSELEPARVPNLFHGTPIRVYGRYAKGGKGAVTVSAEVNGRPYKETIELAFPETDALNPELDRMWAWHRVQELLKQADRTGGRDASVIDRIVELGETYSIASEYTSFLVLENDAEYQRWKIERRNAQRIGRDRARQESLRAELDRIRDNSLASIGPVDSIKLSGATPVAAPAAPPLQVASVPGSPVRPSTVSSPPAPVQAPERSLRLFNGGGSSSGGSSGGGALDPVTAALFLIAVGGAALASRRPREN